MTSNNNMIAAPAGSMQAVFATFATIVCMAFDIGIAVGLFLHEATPFCGNLTWCFGIFSALITVQFIAIVMFLLAKNS